MSGCQIAFTGLRRQYNNLREEILDITDAVLSTGQVMSGPWTQQFEDWLAAKNRKKHAITCHSGTNALEILASYWTTHWSGMSGPTPTVVIPSVTYVATANAFIRAGWDVYFADVDNYGIIDPSKIPTSLGYQAIVLVGLYGASISHYIPIRYWQEWTNRDIIVIEDAAQHWLSSDSQRTGRGSAISFDPMKNLSCYGNGGAVITNSDLLATFALNVRDNGKQSKHRWTGSNSRMSELDCATLLVKTKYLDQWQARRSDIAEAYIQGFQDANLRCLIDESNFHNHAFHKFVVEVDNRDQVQAELLDFGIETKVHYQYALPDHSAYREYPAPDMLGACYSLTRRVLSLPIYPELTDSEVEYIIDSVLKIVS